MTRNADGNAVTGNHGGKSASKRRRVRLEDIAKDCGVSLSTVSRALAGEKGVRPEIRQQVLEAARRASYAVPVAVAGRKVILAASGAAMIDYVRNQFTLHVLDGLKQRAQSLGLEIVTRSIASGEEQTAVLREAQDDPDVAGMLFLTLDDENILAAIRGFEKPAVLLNGDDPFMQLSSVTPCNRAGARLAAEHLIALGHRRIVFAVCRGRRTIERRFEGWRDALRHHGIAVDDDLILPVEDWLPELACRAVAARIEARGLDFTAVLAAGDSLAVGAMMGVQQKGFSVPDDVSVIGMDDLPQAAFLNPPLTTMHVPMREMGAVALDLLRDGMTGLALPARCVEIACHLVARASTAPAPATAKARAAG